MCSRRRKALPYVRARALSFCHAFTLGGPKVDIHYMYLSGLDWPSWNSPEGQYEYVTLHAQAAKSRNVVPMFTLYQAAAWGEGNLGAFDDRNFMVRYWRGVRVMYQRLGQLGTPSIVHLEPDLWGTCSRRAARIRRACPCASARWPHAIRVGTGEPLLWWQMPLGVPATGSGAAGRYRDNRLKYLFDGPWRFAQAGGIGAVFGTGAPNQTTAKTDGGQLKNALTRYLGYGGNGLN
jgi:hypothetical protein